jgi:hypothetical protein
VADIWLRARVSRLERIARRHEKRFEFDEAAHLYFRSAMLEKSGASRSSNLMRAASCKERAQNWRQQSGLWERLAYELAKETGWKFTDRMESFRARHLEPGQLGIFHIISYEEWTKPANTLVHLDEGEETEVRWLQLAWAYQWGAEEAEANGRLGHAARLWRLAGVSFADERCPVQDHYRQAARSFLHGATCTLRSGDWIGMLRVTEEPWNTKTIDWGDPRTKAATEDQEPGSNDIRDKLLTDLQWHQYAWEEHLEDIKDPGDKAKAREEQERELNQLQQLLIAAGDRSYAARCYQERMRVQLEILRIRHQWMALLFRKLDYWTSRSGSSVRLALLTTFIVNALLLPLLYWSTDAAWGGTSGQHRASFSETVIMSLANVVSFSTSSAHVVTEWASALQVVQAISGYFILAFIVWVTQRFHA